MRHHWRYFLPVLFMLLCATATHSLASEDDDAKKEDAHSAGCLPARHLTHPAAVCAGCHKDAEQRWLNRKHRPCTPYCTSCHKQSEMSRHHKTGVKIQTLPKEGLPVTADMKLACFTCHNLAQPRYDKVRWKATSLFNRLFRSEERYKTYFLTHRNEQGELCLSCH